jgi:DNA-directed RNA polymerase specialized sigma24 family protein
MVDDVRSIANPADRALKAQELQREAVAAKKSLAEIRAEAVREMRANGWSLREIGRHLGVTRGTAQSILEGRSLAKAEAADAEGPDAS